MTSMGELDLLRDDLGRATRHLKEATEWARAHPQSTAASVPYLLATADGALEAMNAASSMIWSLQNEVAVESAKAVMTRREEEGE